MKQYMRGAPDISVRDARQMFATDHAGGFKVGFAAKDPIETIIVRYDATCSFGGTSQRLTNDP
jgi:hypothetical protein